MPELIVQQTTGPPTTSLLEALASYDYRVDGFLGWLRDEHPQVRQFKDLTIDVNARCGLAVVGPDGLSDRDA